MKKTTFFIIIIIVGLFAISLVYIGKVILPSKIKTELIKTLESHLERKVKLGKIKFNLFKGMVLENLVIYDDPKYSEIPLLNISEVNINMPGLSILLQRKFIITSININKAQLKIIRLDKNLWNLSDFIEQKSETTDNKFSFLVYKIALLNSKISFEDRTIEPLFSKTIEDLNLKINLSLGLDAKFNLEAKIKNKEPNSLIFSNGTYSTRNKKLLASIKIKDVLLSEYYSYFKIPNLQLKNGVIKDSEFNLVLEDKKIQISSEAKIEDLDLQQEQMELLGPLDIDTNFGYDPDAKDKLSFSGNINMSTDSIKGIPVLSSIENISGAISFDKDKIQTKELIATSLNCPLKLSGVLENFKNPSINLKINSDIKFSNILGVIPEEIKSNFSETDGNAKLELDVQGYLRNVKNLDYSGKANLYDAFVKLNFLPEKLLNIQADITFNKNGINWRNLSFLYKNFNVSSNGSLSGFVNPLIETELKSDSFNIDTKINVDKNTIGISKLEGNYLNSNFNIAGSLDISERKNPLLNVRLNSDVQLADLKDILTKFSEPLKKANLEGLCNLKATIAGKLADWKSWQTDFKSTSTQISLYGLKLNDAQLQLTQTQNMIKDFSLQSVAYDGPLLINLNMNLSDNFPYLINIDLSNLNLSKLISDTPLKDKPLSGIASLKTQINGNVTESSSLTGDGRFEIKDGNLWELSLLKGLGKFLFIPEFDKIVFSAANADFTIKNKTIHTDNLKFMSDKLNLACEGKIDFERNFDFLIAAQFSNELINNSADLRKVISSAIGQLSEVISVKLTGTVQKPQYSIILKPADLLKKILKGINLNVL